MSNSSSDDPWIELDGSKSPSSEATSNNLLPTATEISLQPSLETLQAAARFREGGNWIVDNSNWEAALLALADRHPLKLKLIARVDALEALPVATIVKAVNRCGIPEVVVEWGDAVLREESEREKPEPKCRCDLESLDNFYTAIDVAIDKDRLEHITSNPSIRLDHFFGHLDLATIEKLPSGLSLGLAIGCAADSAAISAIPPQKVPGTLHLSVTARVAVEELQALPNVSCLHLYFPFLSDDRVNSVRPAIQALMPSLKMWALDIPKCHLTSRGFNHLIEQLRGVEIQYRVIIEPSGTWQPGSEEKISLAVALYRSVACTQVKWGEDINIFPKGYL